jgi:probable F420-dependent oxidoreductase
MKVRIGLGFGGWPFAERHPGALAELVERCDELRIDSIWLSDRIVSPAAGLSAGSGQGLDPITAMAFIAAKSRVMKFGTSALVLGTRHPVPLAQQLATLDFLSQGRLLLVVGIGSATTRDLEATGTRPEERARRADESIVLMRKLWSEDNVTFHGKYYGVEGVSVYPRPWQKPGPPVWIGGRSDGALRRAGRLGDGWLVAGASPEEIARGVETIHRYAAEAGREVPEDHFGAYVPFLFASSQEEALRRAGGLASRLRPDLPVTAHAALGTPDDVRAKVQEYLAAGASKLVMRPQCGPGELYAQLELLAREVVVPFQTPFSAEELRERSGASVA